MIDFIARNHCVLTHKSDLEPLYSFPSFPVFMGTTTQSPESDIFADMNWFISRETGVIQLNPLLPLDVLYPESHNAGCIGGLWATHHETFADFVHEYGGQSVLEIGGGHGILARNYARKYGRIPWTIIEPNPTPVDGCPAEYIRGFFDSSFTIERCVDTVVHSHILEHVYEPNEFTSHLSSFMAPESVLIFSVPNMQVMLERKYTNCMNFEHTAYLSVNYIKFLLEKNNFKIKKVEYFLEDHSIFFVAEKNSDMNINLVCQDEYIKNKELYCAYIDFHKTLVSKINKITASGDFEVFLFGAHIFSLYLIAFGLNKDNVISILDNDISKQGKRLYGTTLDVKSPKVLSQYKAPLVILRAGVYDDEIKKDILLNVNENTVFI